MDNLRESKVGVRMVRQLVCASLKRTSLAYKMQKLGISRPPE
jgi:hypothetical protein